MISTMVLALMRDFIKNLNKKFPPLTVSQRREFFVGNIHNEYNITKEDVSFSIYENVRKSHSTFNYNDIITLFIIFVKFTLMPVQTQEP